MSTAPSCARYRHLLDSEECPGATGDWSEEGKGKNITQPRQLSLGKLGELLRLERRGDPKDEYEQAQLLRGS